MDQAGASWSSLDKWENLDSSWGGRKGECGDEEPPAWLKVGSSPDGAAVKMKASEQ